MTEKGTKKDRSDLDVSRFVIWLESGHDFPTFEVIKTVYSNCSKFETQYYVTRVERAAKEIKAEYNRRW